MMTEQEVYAGLTEILHDAFGDAARVLTPDMTAKDVPGWDSVSMLGIIAAVEDRFSIKIRSRDVDNLASVGDLAKLIQAKAR
jgi:acyl carrier protein